MREFRSVGNHVNDSGGFLLWNSTRNSISGRASAYPATTDSGVFAAVWLGNTYAIVVRRDHPDHQADAAQELRHRVQVPGTFRKLAHFHSGGSWHYSR